TSLPINNSPEFASPHDEIHRNHRFWPSVTCTQSLSSRNCRSGGAGISPPRFQARSTRPVLCPFAPPALAAYAPGGRGSRVSVSLSSRVSQCAVLPLRTAFNRQLHGNGC